MIAGSRRISLALLLSALAVTSAMGAVGPTAIGDAKDLCQTYLHKIAKKAVQAGIIKKGDAGLTCCQVHPGLESVGSDPAYAALGAGASSTTSDGSLLTIDVDTIGLDDQKEIAKRFVFHSMTASYGAESPAWRDYSPNPDPLDRRRRVMNYLFSNATGARIPGRISELLASEVKANFRTVQDARQLVADGARPLAEKYISAAFSDYSQDVVAMFQNSRGSQAEFFAPLVNRIQGVRLDFKQVLEDSDQMVQVQSDLFIASQPLRDMPELMANPRYQALQEQIDVAFFRRYTDVLSPHDSSVLDTLAALSSGKDPSETDRLPAVSDDLRAQLDQIQERLTEATKNLRASRRRYALGYRAAAMDLALLNRLGKPRGDKFVESTNILRLLDQDSRLTSGELHAGLYQAAIDVIVEQGFFKDEYYDFSVQGITADNIMQIAHAAGAFAGPRVFSIILTDERMKHEFDLGEMEALLEEDANLRQNSRLEKQTKWTDGLVVAAGLAWKWGKSMLPVAAQRLPDDLVTKALNNQRQALANHGFQEVAPVDPASVPRNMKDLLVSCRSDIYGPADLSVQALMNKLQKDLGPLPGYEGPLPPERLTLAEDLVTGIMRDGLPAGPPPPANAEVAVQAVAVVQAAAPVQAVAAAPPVAPVPPPVQAADAPAPPASGAGVDGTIALQRTLSILSRRADVLRRFDVELGIRTLVYLKAYAADDEKFKAEMRKVNNFRRIWEREHQDLLDRVEELNQAVIDSFRAEGKSKSVALATLADSLPTGLRHFIINVGGRVREKLVPLHARVLIQIINDLNPTQLLGMDQLKEIATAASAVGDVQTNIGKQRKVAFLAAGTLTLVGGLAFYHYVYPYLHSATPPAPTGIAAPATPAAPHPQPH